MGKIVAILVTVAAISVAACNGMGMNGGANSMNSSTNTATNSTH
jgi:hypothetical protein